MLEKDTPISSAWQPVIMKREDKVSKTVACGPRALKSGSESILLSLPSLTPLQAGRPAELKYVSPRLPTTFPELLEDLDVLSHTAPDSPFLQR